MPLTIKPVSSVCAMMVADYPRFTGLSHFFIWIGTVKQVTDDGYLSNYTTRGFIRTSKSVISTAHDCDNMQLSGSLVDFRFLHNCKMKMYGDPNYGGYDVMHLLDANSSTYVPCHQLVDWGETFAFYGTDLFNRPKIACAITTLNNCWTTFSISLDGDVWWSGAYFDVQLNFQPNGIKIGQLPTKGKTVRISLGGLRSDRKTMDEVIIPRIRALVSDGWETQPVSSWEYTRPVYIEATTLPPNSDPPDLYRLEEYSWLTAIESYTDAFKVEFGELHYRALSKIDTFTSNGLAYLKDAKGILEELRSLYSTLRGKVTPKGISSLFLSFKYGLPLTYSDTKDLVAAIKAVRHNSSSVTQETGIVDGNIKQTCTIRYKPIDTVVEEAYSLLRYLDLLASPENVWDLIPFSFVFDWFIDLGDKLKRLDQLDHLSNINLDAVYDTSILTLHIPSTRIMEGVVGIIGVRRYTRKCHLDASFPLIVPDKPSQTSHWLEGTALIIQKLFK